MPNTWTHDHLRACGYDLTMAADLLVVPDRPEHPHGRRYPIGEARVAEVLLEPGDVAFVSSAELCCIPWDVVGLLGPKFSLASRGLLLLTGLVVDPGYGLTQDIDGMWTPEGSRLHFLLANMGSDTIVLLPGKERIASLQFFAVEEPHEKASVPSMGFQRIHNRFFQEGQAGDAGLVFFRTMAELGGKVEALRTTVQLTEDRIGQGLNSINQRLGTVEAGANQIVMFGVYLLSVTVFGAALAAILSILSQLKVQVDSLNAVVLATGIVVVGVITTALLHALRKLSPTRQPR